MGSRSKNLTREQVLRTYGIKDNKLEERIAKQIAEQGHEVRYEKKVIKYIQPEKNRRYTPDFVLDNDIIIECKGRFLTADRMKHLMIKKQFPDLDIRIVFQKYADRTRICSNSKTTVGEWCTKHGIRWAVEPIPEEWFHE